MIALTDHVIGEGLTQSQAAKLLGVTQPRISDLVNMAVLAGLRIEMHIGKAA